MAPKGKGSSSGKTQGTSSRKIQFSAPLLEVTFHNALRARDSLSNSADAILFLPSTPAESNTLQKLWRKFPNTIESAFKQPEFEPVDDMDFPQRLPSDYQDQVPTNFYPSQLVQMYPPFAKGPLCRVNASFLYRGLRLVQEAISEIQASNKSRAKTQANIIQLLEDPVIQNALRYLEAAEYTRLVYDEARSTGFGVSLALRTAVKNFLKSTTPTMATLAIPISFDALSREGQLIIKVASTGSPPQFIKNPFTDQNILPEPGYEVHASVSTPPPEAGSSNVGIASPIISNDGVASPVGSPFFPAEDEDLGETEASSDELEELDVYQGSRVRTRAGTDLGTLRHSTTRPKPEKIGPPIGKGKAKAAEASKPVVTVSVKRERPDEEKSSVGSLLSVLSPTPLTRGFQSHTTPALKKQKTGKAAGKARAVTPTLSAETDELEPALISEAAASSMAMDQLLANDDRDITRQVSFLANPDYKPRIAFSTLVSPGHNLKRRPDHQVLRMPKWVATPELASVGSFLTVGNASFSISNLARFAYLTTRGIAPSTSPLDPDIAPTTDCVSCLIRGLTCRNGEQIGGPCAGSPFIWNYNRICWISSQRQSARFPGTSFLGFSESVGQLQEALNAHFRILENAGEIIQNSLLGIARHVNRSKLSGLDANVVLSLWAKEHPGEQLDYNTACWFATFFGWNSSCNLSAYLKDPGTLAKFQEFLRTHDVEVPAPPFNEMLYENEIAAKDPSPPPVVREYSHMTAQSGPVEEEKPHQEIHSRPVVFQGP
ncbi:hypothetical protein C8R42DRAFT_724474 [Lentinula raphanica]|nr:hypothetical protein C8R42DRAFT_724474 [Lentinula raphanica]